MLINIIFFVASLVSLGLSLHLFYKYKKLKDNAVFTKGEIIRINRKVTRSFEDKRTDYFPVILFTDTKGKRHELQSDVGELSKKHILIGSHVDVIYQKGNPRNFTTKDNFNLFFPMLAFIIFLALIMLAVFI